MNSPSVKAPRVLLVAIAIGEEYKKKYEAIFYPSQKAYADRHGYDIKVVDGFLDLTTQERSFISLQKILVCSQSWSHQYEFIVFVDSDILISPNAPAIHKAIDFGKNIGIVDEYLQPTHEERLLIQKKMGWEKNAEEYYRLSGFQITTQRVLNTGVLVLQPKFHQALLEDIYKATKSTGLNHPRGFHYEQSSIGYNLLTNARYALLPSQWNAIWAVRKYSPNLNQNLKQFIAENYFVHFAGDIDIDVIGSSYFSTPELIKRRTKKFIKWVLNGFNY